MKHLKKITYLFALICFSAAALAATASAQDRPRVVRSVSSQPINQPAPAPPSPSGNRTSIPQSSNTTPQASPRTTTRPALTNQIIISRPTSDPAAEPLYVKKTASVSSNAAAFINAGRSVYSANTSFQILKGIQSKLGIPYLYGSSGPNRYDCSGFVWAVFSEAGIGFTRSSARTLWSMSEPVDGADRYKFGTLVFLNGLGHMGIVADENGFYHASSSRGITYSPFKGYWEKRIVGFRRLPHASIESDQDTAR